jgi:hypothetical protein
LIFPFLHGPHPRLNSLLAAAHHIIKTSHISRHLDAQKSASSKNGINPF